MARCTQCLNWDECQFISCNWDTDEECYSFRNADDFVEVVRCKDCKYCEHFYPEKLPGKLPREAYYCSPKRLGVSANSYCSDGQRKSK